MRSLFLALFALLLIYAFWIEPRRLTVERFDIAAPGLSAPLKIVAFGDTQSISVHWDEERLSGLVARINAENPDLVIFLGDAAGWSHGAFKKLYNDWLYVPPEGIARAFSGLKAPMGVYGVLGNHDWWWDAPRMKSLLEGAGLRMLSDEGALAVHSGSGARLWIAGVEDRASGRPPDWIKALAGAPEGAPVLALPHRPDEAMRLTTPAALILAGHTHGGQICLPLIGCPIARFVTKGLVRGRYDLPAGPLLVTRGVGTG